MANTTTSPNMSLPIPVVGVDPGPDYATNVNSSLTIVDGHNHSPGYGVQINPSGININSDLAFNNNNGTILRSVRFAPQSAPLGLSSDIGCLYESSVDLYYNDGNGNQIQITKNGAIAGTAGSISNLVPPASASYSPVSETFIWQSAANTPANLDAASIVLRNLVANSKGLTLSPPNAMPANYTVTLPTLPSQTSILTISSAGVIAPTYTLDNVTIQSNSGVLFAKSIANGYTTYEFKLNGNYGSISTPNLELDGYCFFNYAATILNVWAYSVVAGASGTTTIDLQYTTSPGGSFTSIFSTPASFTSAAASSNYVDAQGVVTPGTGVTAPVLSTSNLPAGSAIRMSILSVMAGASDCGIVIQFNPT